MLTTRSLGCHTIVGFQPSCGKGLGLPDFGARGILDKARGVVVAEGKPKPWVPRAWFSNATPSSDTDSVSPDDDVILTARCAERLAELTKERGKTVRLRLAVEGGGCSGFSYVFELEESGPGEYVLSSRSCLLAFFPAFKRCLCSQYLWTSSTRDDVIFARGESELVVDDSSMEFLRGATVDFAEDLLRSSFAVINNPNSASSCGCGSSFMAKDWEE